MRLPAFTVRPLLALHANAQATPYFHLPEYMVRAWVLGDRSPERNADRPADQPWHGRAGGKMYCFIVRHIAIRAHEILRSDNERHLHDHPCWSLSIVLAGGYWEICEVDAATATSAAYMATVTSVEHGWFDPSNPEHRRRAAIYSIHWRPPGAVVFRSATAAHRLVLPRGTTAKSLFVLGRKTNSWGFYTACGKVPWRQYLGLEAKQ